MYTSSFVGSVQMCIRDSYRSRTILFALSLLILNNLFFMLRSSFSESFFNLFTMQFLSLIHISEPTRPY
ncbi:O-antigen polysaccharide polymerase Wzy [Streptococcus pneumoniae D39]|nr:O-antigen polysaccharide polymerase Wzy [Streptococcus pneumoniae D39]